jgi:hypothetical protein
LKTALSRRDNTGAAHRSFEFFERLNRRLLRISKNENQHETGHDRPIARLGTLPMQVVSS